MPEGRQVRQDDVTGEKLAMKGTKKLDPSLQNAMTAEDGPLTCGALPAIKAASEAGAKHIFTALDEEGKLVSKVPKRKTTKEKEGEEVKPKTVLE